MRFPFPTITSLKCGFDELAIFSSLVYNSKNTQLLKLYKNPITYTYTLGNNGPPVPSNAKEAATNSCFGVGRTDREQSLLAGPQARSLLGLKVRAQRRRGHFLPRGRQSSPKSIGKFSDESWAQAGALGPLG